MYTYLFQFDCEQVIPTYINHSQPLIPDRVYLIFLTRFKRKEKSQTWALSKEASGTEHSQGKRSTTERPLLLLCFYGCCTVITDIKVCLDLIWLVNSYNNRLKCEKCLLVITVNVHVNIYWFWHQIQRWICVQKRNNGSTNTLSKYCMCTEKIPKYCKQTIISTHVSINSQPPFFLTSQTSRRTSMSMMEVSLSFSGGNRYWGSSFLNHSCSLVG